MLLVLYKEESTLTYQKFLCFTGHQVWHLSPSLTQIIPFVPVMSVQVKFLMMILLNSQLKYVLYVFSSENMFMMAQVSVLLQTRVFQSVE